MSGFVWIFIGALNRALTPRGALTPFRDTAPAPLDCFSDPSLNPIRRKEESMRTQFLSLIALLSAVPLHG